MLREATSKVLEMVQNGELDRDAVITACLNYMSEDDVADMARSNEFFDIDEDEEPTEYEFEDDDEVNEAFAEQWEARCADVPAFRTDKPAKRMAFTCFVDELYREGRISAPLANNATLPEDACELGSNTGVSPD